MATYNGFKGVLENKNKIAEELVNYAKTSKDLKPEEVYSLIGDKFREYFEQTFGAKAREKDAADAFFKRYAKRNEDFTKLTQALMIVPVDYIQGIGAVSEAMKSFSIISDSYGEAIKNYPKEVDSKVKEILKVNEEKSKVSILEQIVLEDIYKAKKKSNP